MALESGIAALDDILEDANLTHLHSALAGQSSSELHMRQRPELLAHLKTLGLSLSDRQRVATEIAKAARSVALSHEVVELQQGPTMHGSLEPQGFSIYCHHTTLANGQQLSNADPAPEFIIAALEERTRIPRPPHASTLSLERLNLHFMSGASGGANANR